MHQIREVSVDNIRELVSPRAVSGETMLLNMGPQHPSTHGVLRLLLELDGETVVSCIPDIGFLHTGVEKNMESKTYQQAEVMTDRLDYMNPLGNNLVYCLAVEKLAELEEKLRIEKESLSGDLAQREAKLKAQIEELKKTIAEREKEIERVNGVVGQKDTEIGKLNKKIAELEEEIGEMRKKIQELGTFSNYF